MNRISTSLDSRQWTATAKWPTGALELVNSQMQDLTKAMPQLIPSHSQSCTDILNHVHEQEGKRVRPFLYFLCCHSLGYSGDHLIPMAAVGEFIHVASLLHDDVIDDSPLRRGKPTVHTRWGQESAILVGDLIYSRASELMAATQKIEIVAGFARTIRMMSEGELLQIENVFNLELSEEKYFEILDHKTASLLGMVCRSAAILSDQSYDIAQTFYDYGRYVGLAFQLIDDVLDYQDSDDTLKSAPPSKPKFQDLKEGRVTLPLILIRQLATQQELEQLRALCERPDLTPKDLGWIRTLLTKYDVLSTSMHRAQDFSRLALESLQKLENLGFERLEPLREMTAALLERSS